MDGQACTQAPAFKHVAACGSCETGAPSAAPCPPPHPLLAESEQEQALAVGACRVLEGRAVWRYISRDWDASRALLLALLASGGWFVFGLCWLSVGGQVNRPV